MTALGDLPQRRRILLVEDEEGLSATLADLLATEGFEPLRAGSLAAARLLLERHEVELVLLDLSLPDGSGFELLNDLEAPPQGPTVLVLTVDASVASTVAAVRRGAYDYLVKPFDVDALLHRLSKAVEHRQVQARAALSERMQRLEALAHPLAALVSAPMRRLHERLARMADHVDLPILVRGETGVGKEHLCRLVHDLSPRAHEPFVTVNCATFERALLQSELFGHERGAFTGAHERRRGLFELAQHGTLLLDEVAEMPLDVQAAFLRVLETGRFRRLGGSTEVSSDARVVAATHQDLEALVESGRFRNDLYYRLNALELVVPPLRERPGDVRVLAEHFCQRLAASKRIAVHLTEDAHRALAAYDWPGNVRELKNVVERTAAFHGPGAITAADLALRPARTLAAVPAATSAPGIGGEPFPTLAAVEAAHVRRALARCDGNRTHAARLLGIARSTLIRKLAELETSSADSSQSTVASSVTVVE